MADPSYSTRLSKHAQDLDADGHDALAGSPDNVRDAGRWEHVTEPGSASPPVDVYSPDGTEWVYAWVTPP